MTTKTRATIEDLYAVPGKTELVNGKLVLMSPTGGIPGFAGDEISFSLRSFVRMTRFGRAVGDNKGFLTHLPNRKSFSPDIVQPGCGVLLGATGKYEIFP